jgi:hypothetical protein
MTDPSLTASFKTAANAVALLYKESITTSKKAHESGYQACLQDLWSFLSLQLSNREQSSSASSHQEQSPSSATPSIPLSDLETFFRTKLFEFHNQSMLSQQEFLKDEQLESCYQEHSNEHRFLPLNNLQNNPHLQQQQNNPHLQQQQNNLEQQSLQQPTFTTLINDPSQGLQDSLKRRWNQTQSPDNSLNNIISSATQNRSMHMFVEQTPTQQNHHFLDSPTKRSRTIRLSASLNEHSSQQDTLHLSEQK